MCSILDDGLQIEDGKYNCLKCRLSISIQSILMYSSLVHIYGKFDLIFLFDQRRDNNNMESHRRIIFRLCGNPSMKPLELASKTVFELFFEIRGCVSASISLEKTLEN